MILKDGIRRRDSSVEADAATPLRGAPSETIYAE